MHLVKQKVPPSVSFSAPLVRVAKARFAAQFGDLKRAKRELGLAADQAGDDAYLNAAWQAIKEGQ